MINNLKKLRAEKGWSVLQLAAKSGVPKEVIARMENADNLEGFEPTDVVKVARPFGIMVRKVFAPENAKQWEKQENTKEK